MNKTLTIVLALIATAACSGGSEDVVGQAAETMGATDLTSIQYSATGSNYALGQAHNPGVTGPRFNVTSYSRVIDYEAPASRQEMVRTQGDMPPRGGGGIIMGEQRRVQLVSGDRAWNMDGDAATPALASTVDRRLEIWVTPHGFLKQALRSNPTVESQMLDGRDVTVVTLTNVEGKYTLKGFINDGGLVERIDTWTPNVHLGDMLVSYQYSGYQDFNGVMFPTQIDVQAGGFPSMELTVSQVEPNVAAEITVPDNVQQATASPPAPVRLNPTPLATGVWHLPGAAASPTLVEFSDHAVVFEASGDDARTLAVLEAARELVPGKPVRFVVDSHYHFDHSGGLRGYAAEDVTIVTHENNLSFYQQAWQSPWTLEPDLLARSGKTPTFEPVGDKHVLTDSTRTMELYSLPGNDHTDGLLMAYLPAEKMLLVSDVYSPGHLAGDPDLGYPHPWNVQLMDHIQQRKLDVQQLVPVHGEPHPISDLIERVKPRT